MERLFYKILFPHELVMIAIALINFIVILFFSYFDFDAGAHVCKNIGLLLIGFSWGYAYHKHRTPPWLKPLYRKSTESTN